MGLDMYLSKKIYIGANYQHRNVKLNIKCSINKKPIKINSDKVTYIIEEVGYWRKANHIHNWFIQLNDGVDDCNPISVEREDLIKLMALCKEVKETKNVDLLPRTQGFFFGSTEFDECYYSDIDETIEILENVLNDNNDNNIEFEYRASW